MPNATTKYFGPIGSKDAVGSSKPHDCVLQILWDFIVPDIKTCLVAEEGCEESVEAMGVPM